MRTLDLRLPLWKLVQRPLLPIRDTWQDAVPLLALFLLLSLAALAAFRLRGRTRSVVRRIVQLLAAFIFVVFLHRCLCALRGWAFGLQLIGVNNLIAFGHLSVFVIIIAFTALHGRLFCGWLCPLSLPQEVLGKLAHRRQRIPTRRVRLAAAYVLLTGLVIVCVWLAMSVRPATQFFSENVAALWGGALLVMLFFVLPFEGRDQKLRAIKYVSAGAWLGLSAVGVFVTNPWCVLMGDEMDYSSLVALLAVIAGTLVVSSAWCRYLCPMGAALGLLAKCAPIKINNPKTCDGCGQCEGVCPTGAIYNGEVHQSSCIYCGECVGVCEFQWENQLAQETAGAKGDKDK